MKRIIFSMIFVLGLVASSVAQETFPKDDRVLNFGVGISRDGATSFPPLSVTYEQSVLDGIVDFGSLGLGLQSEVTAFPGSLALFIGPRVAFHYEFADNLDTYLGVQAGLGFASSKLSFDWAAILGARYYLSHRWGVFAEFGTGLSVLKLGTMFRL